MVTDISNLKHQGFCCKVFFVSRAILGYVCSAAKTTTNVPGPSGGARI